MKSVLNLTQAMGAALPSESFVIAGAAHIERLRADAHEGLEGVNLLALDPSSPVPSDVLQAAKVMIVEIDPDVPDSLARIRRIRSSRPDLPLVAAIADAQFTLVRMLLRQGVKDVVALPFDAEDVIAQLLDISAQQATSKASVGEMVAMVGSVGGAGSSTVLTHLAGRLSDRGSVCVIDLDMQSGQTTFMLDAKPKMSVLDLTQQSERLDADMLRDAMVQTAHGFSLLGAPDTINPLEDVDVEKLLRLLTVARSAFDFVLLDMPSAWTNWSLSVACACRSIAIVTDASIGGLRGAKRSLELFETVGMAPSSTSVILNKAERRFFQAISADSVADTLGRQVIGTLTYDRDTLQKAQDAGHLIWQEKPRTPFGKDIDQLAANLVAHLAGDA